MCILYFNTKYTHTFCKGESKIAVKHANISDGHDAITYHGNYPFHFDHKITKSIFIDRFIFKSGSPQWDKKLLNVKRKMSHTQLLRGSSKMQEDILKTLARRFQFGIHFNLGYA